MVRNAVERKERRSSGRLKSMALIACIAQTQITTMRSEGGQPSERREARELIMTFQGESLGIETDTETGLVIETLLKIELGPRDGTMMSESRTGDIMTLKTIGRVFSSQVLFRVQVGSVYIFWTSDIAHEGCEILKPRSVNLYGGC